MQAGVILGRSHLSFTSQTEITLKLASSKLVTLPKKARTFAFLTAKTEMSCLSPFLYPIALRESF
jgi:hypothetical protein